MSSIHWNDPYYYLDCPFEEKDQVKSPGARWDATARKWFVPLALYPHIDRFNRWTPNGKIYLDCPYEERDQAKKAGAVWDGVLQRWCVFPTKTGKAMKKFSKWLSVDPSDAVAMFSSTTKSNVTPTKLSTTTSASRRRGNAADAALLRINENMTVGQLQEECKFRGIKGLSGKNKDWLLEQLEIGSIWQANRQEQAEAVTTRTEKAADKKPLKATKESPKKKAKVEKAKSTAKTSVKSVAAVDFSHLPRISSSLTLAQLSHEILFRDPNSKGISSKPKTWFLSQLGENSIWLTCPNLSVDLTNVPRVSKNMTVAQLVHELLTRTPSMTGLSSKKKEELLSLAGIGSIWTTSQQTSVSNMTAKQATPIRKGSSAAIQKATTAKLSLIKTTTAAVEKASSTKRAPKKPHPTMNPPLFAKAPKAIKSVTLKSALKTAKTPAPVKSSSATLQVRTTCARKWGYDPLNTKNTAKVKTEASSRRIKPEPVWSSRDNYLLDTELEFADSDDTDYDEETVFL